MSRLPIRPAALAALAAPGPTYAALRQPAARRRSQGLDRVNHRGEPVTLLAGPGGGARRGVAGAALAAPGLPGTPSATAAMIARDRRRAGLRRL